MDKYADKIFEHSFGAEVHSSLRKIPNLERREWSELSDAEQYVIDVFMWTARLADSFNRLEHIRAYLAHRRILKQHRESGINRANYIRYHYSNHAATLLGIFDIALILTNNVFRLGLPERQCRSEIITQNCWVRSKGIDKILKKFDSAVEPLRESRHLYLHRGYPRDSEPLWYLRGMELSSRADSSSRIVLARLAERTCRAEVSRILNEITRQEETVFNAASELLTSLHPVYKF